MKTDKRNNQTDPNDEDRSAERMVMFVFALQTAAALGLIAISLIYTVKEGFSGTTLLALPGLCFSVGGIKHMIQCYLKYFGKNNDTKFALHYTFFDDTHETELSMIIDGRNILAFERNGSLLTTRWNLDELTSWLSYFMEHMQEDLFPVEAEGEYAAIKDLNARKFGSDDEEVFDDWYNKLDEWNLRHRWHTASSGAILADVYFQLVGENVEISWNNKDAEEGVVFQEHLGGSRIPKRVFTDCMYAFLKAYTIHWFGISQAEQNKEEASDR